MPFSITLNARKLALLLGAVTIILVILSFSGKLAESSFDRIPRGVALALAKFDVNAERSIPTWYATSLLLACGLTLGVIAHFKRQQREPYRVHWLLLALTFVAMSVEEVAGLHEETVEPLAPWVSHIPWLVFGWVVLGVLAVILFGVVFFRFWRHLAPRTRFLTALAAVVYIGGSVVFEILDGYEYALRGDTQLYWLMNSFEELFEMLGCVIFLYALLDHLAITLPHFTIVLSGQPDKPDGPTLRLSPLWIGRRLVGVTVVITILSLIGRFLTQSGQASYLVETLAQLVDVNAESSLATWYGTTLLMLGGLSVGLVALYWLRQHTADRFHWLLMSLLLMGMSLDEIATFHEELNEPLRRRLGDIDWLYFGWVVIGALAVVGVVGVFFRFWRRLEPKSQRLFALAAAIFVTGGLGVQLFASREYAHFGSSLPYGILSNIEEFGEILGAALFLYAILDYAARNLPPLDIVIRSGSPAAEASPTPIHR